MRPRAPSPTTVSGPRELTGAGRQPGWEPAQAGAGHRCADGPQGVSLSCSAAVVDGLGRGTLAAKSPCKPGFRAAVVPEAWGPAGTSPPAAVWTCCDPKLVQHTPSLGCAHLHPAPAGGALPAADRSPPAPSLPPGMNWGCRALCPVWERGNAGLLPGPLPPPRLCLRRPGLLWVPRRVPGCFRAGQGCPKQRLWALGVSSAPHVTPWGKRSDDAVTKGDWQGRAGTSGAQGPAPASLRPDSSCPGL